MLKGGDNHLAVVLEPYAPTIRCEGSERPLTRQSCAMIERGMEADDRPRLFGDERVDPRVQEPLPYELVSSEATRPATYLHLTVCADVNAFFSGLSVCCSHL